MLRMQNSYPFVFVVSSEVDLTNSVGKAAKETASLTLDSNSDTIVNVKMERFIENLGAGKRANRSAWEVVTGDKMVHYFDWINRLTDLQCYYLMSFYTGQRGRDLSYAELFGILLNHCELQSALGGTEECFVPSVRRTSPVDDDPHFPECARKFAGCIRKIDPTKTGCLLIKTGQMVSFIRDRKRQLDFNYFKLEKEDKNAKRWLPNVSLVTGTSNIWDTDSGDVLQRVLRILARCYKNKKIPLYVPGNRFKHPSIKGSK